MLNLPAASPRQLGIPKMPLLVHVTLQVCLLTRYQTQTENSAPPIAYLKTKHQTVQMTVFNVKRKMTFHYIFEQFIHKF